MSRVLRTAFVVGVVLASMPIADLHAQSTRSFPEMPVDSRTARTQSLAEDVFTRGDHERAFFIYRKELAPIGDKYGQYMVGYMHLTGTGVERDIIAASAWYRLAAERGTKEFVHARDHLMAQLTAEQREHSDRLFIDIRKQYGDLVLLARAVRRDYQRLKNRTGSRIGADSGSLKVVYFSGQADDDYYGRIERRINARLKYIERHTDIGVLDLDTSDIDLSLIEEQVTAHLSRLP